MHALHPGSHAARRLYAHEHAAGGDLVLNRRVAPSEFDPADARDDALRAGELSMHDVYLIHGSNPNRSGCRRAGYVMRYFPGTTFYDREMEVGQSSDIGVSDFAERPIWLARGMDRTGRTTSGSVTGGRRRRPLRAHPFPLPRRFAAEPGEGTGDGGEEGRERAGREGERVHVQA